jgi:hypothetical protein
MDEKTFIFHWLGGKSEPGKGTSVSDAFIKLGYGAGAMRALDYYEE